MKIKITNEAYQKLKYFILSCDTEIAGLGKVSEIEIEQECDEYNGMGYGSDLHKKTESVPALLIHDIEILPQKVTGVHATLDEDALAKFLTNKIKSGEDVSEYKVWWHSHVDMEAYFSHIDKATIEESTEFPYLISIVGNKKMEFETRIDIFKPLRITLPAVLDVEHAGDKKIEAWCKKEIEEKVESERFNWWPNSGNKKRKKKKKNRLNNTQKQYSSGNVDDEDDDLLLPGE